MQLPNPETEKQAVALMLKTFELEPIKQIFHPSLSKVFDEEGFKEFIISMMPYYSMSESISSQSKHYQEPFNRSMMTESMLSIGCPDEIDEDSYKVLILFVSEIYRGYCIGIDNSAYSLDAPLSSTPS